MKTLFTAALFVLISGAMLAQPTIRTVYRDSLSGTGVTTAAKNTRGYDVFKGLRTDIGAMADKFLQIKFTKVTDSARVWGGTIDFGQDTVWTVLPVSPLELKSLAAINTAKGVKEVRDTTVLWITPVTTDQMVFTFDMSKYYFGLYRVTSGLNDSGKTYINDVRRGGY